MTTLHVLPNFAAPTGLNTRTDPFTTSPYWFTNYMPKHGYRAIHYGHPDSQVNCEHVSVAQGDYDVMNRSAGEEIAKRKQPGDLIISLYGTGNYGAAVMNPDLKAIEAAIGYAVDTIFAPYRVFTSYAHMHLYYGYQKMLMNPSWYDTVIPNGFEPNEFEYSEKKKDYLLYFGRVITTKGVQLCIQVAQRTGHHLVIAGPGSLAEFGYDRAPDNVTVLGPCNAEQRRALMRDAKALIGPTYYVEPFGNMVVEALFSGTPVITTDWGGFTDTNLDGVTGYRCRDWSDFITAVNNIDQIKPSVCRAWAESKFTNEIVHEQMDRYFRKIMKSDFYAENY